MSAPIQNTDTWSSREDSGCYSVSIKYTWLSRLGRKLFPPCYCPLPTASPQYKDVLTNDVTVQLDWKDRVRVLLSGRFRVESRVVTQNTIGELVNGSTFYALPPKFMEPKEGR